MKYVSYFLSGDKSLASSLPTLASAAPGESAVIGKAVMRAADLLGLRNAALASIVGLSEASVSRLKAGGFVLDPGSKPFELAVLLIRLFRGLDAIVGGDSTALRSWMTTENTALQATPATLIRTIPGLVQAVQYVDHRRARL